MEKGFLPSPGGVPDCSPQALQEALFLHPLPPHSHKHRATTATSPPSTLGKVLCPCPDPSLAPGSGSSLSVPQTSSDLPPLGEQPSPGPGSLSAPCPASPPKSGSLRGGGQRRFPESLSAVAWSQMAGPGTSGSGMFLPPAPSGPPYVFLNLRCLIQLARPGIQLKMLSGLAQNYIFGYF